MLRLVRMFSLRSLHHITSPEIPNSLPANVFGKQQATRREQRERSVGQLFRLPVVQKYADPKKLGKVAGPTHTQSQIIE
ncbi:hypothetical protein AB4305_27260 [Nocardia sp. 2YAB30]|uniref:hypothetical protein n=1 Tax=Nocardia sp. 2YAB30 TaxID=3233022 RepID=UPI003F9E7504